MNKEIKTIDPSEGLGVLKFGMSKEDVKAIIGEANEIESFSYTEDDDEQTESWHYDELDLSLSFDKEDKWQLVSLAVTSDNYHFHGKNMLGLNEDSLVEELNKLKIDGIEIEDVSEDETSSQLLVSCEDLGINFWLEDDVVTEIQWSSQLD